MPSSTEQYVQELDEDIERIQESLENFFDSIGVFFMDGRIDKILNNNRGRERRKSWSGVSGEAIKHKEEFLQEYEAWCAAGSGLIAEYLPKREEEFDGCRNDVIDLIELNHEPEQAGKQETLELITNKIEVQRRLLNAVPARVEAERHQVHQTVSRQLSKKELVQARRLLDEGLARASGVIAGVVLEQHLLTMCEEADEDLEFQYDDGITSLSHKLFEADEIDKTTLKSLQTLGGIRNDCAHANAQEPNEHRVRRLIEDTDDYIRGRGI